MEMAQHSVGFAFATDIQVTRRGLESQGKDEANESLIVALLNTAEGFGSSAATFTPPQISAHASLVFLPLPFRLEDVRAIAEVKAMRRSGDAKKTQYPNKLQLAQSMPDTDTGGLPS